MIYHYIKSFFSNIRKNKFFYSINFIGFLTGFLLLTVIISFAYQELSFDKFHTNSENIYRIHCNGYGVTPVCFHGNLENKIPEISNIIRFVTTELTITKNETDHKIGKIYYTDPEIFQVFSFKLISGDPETVLNGPFSIVINESTAFKLFGTNSAIGKTVKNTHGDVLTISGIMKDIPYNSHIQAKAFVSMKTLEVKEDLSSCSNWSILTYIQTNNKAKIGELEKKINDVLEDSRMHGGDRILPLEIQSLDKIYFDAENNKYDGSKHGDFKTVLIYLGVSFLILFIVIINYINLSTSIAITRTKEIAIRKTLGANKFQIINQILFESFGIALISFAFSLIILELLLPQFSKLLNLNIYLINKPVLYSFFLAIILFSALLSGLFPSIILSKVNITKSLNNKNTSNTSGIYRKILLITQLCILAILLNSTFLLNKQINYLFNKDIGFNYENVIYFELNEELQTKKDVLKANLLKIKNVNIVSFSNGLIGNSFSKAFIGNPGNEKLSNFYSVDPDYFNLLDIKIKEGRNFSWDLSTDFDDAYIINETALKTFDLNDPLNIQFNGREIIGFVRDFNFTSLHNEIEPLLITCSNSGKYVQIKVLGKNINETLNYITEICTKISPDFEFKHSFLKDRLKNLYKSEINLKQNLSIYSFITIIIALLGLFGLTLFTINKKVKEISIKKIYGAGFKNIMKDLTKDYLWIVLFSSIIAIPISYFLAEKLLSGFQYRIDLSFDIFLKTFLLSSVFIFGSISFILIKASRLNPIEALKHE